jgi:LacI family transcriptional regulator
VATGEEFRYFKVQVLDNSFLACNNVTGYCNRFIKHEKNSTTMTKRSHSITIRDVARQAGVSVATVSRYTNHRASVSEEIAKRIQQVMQDLNYVPLVAARQLATRKTGTVGLLSFSVGYGFFGPLVAGLEKVLKENGYNLLIATYQGDTGNDITPPIGPQNADGVVVFSNTLCEERLAEWYDAHFPVVLVHRTAPNFLPIPSVNVENTSAAYEIVEHLIQAHGRKQIVFVQAPGYQEDAHCRELAYKSALKAHSISFDPRLIIGGKFDRSETRQAMEKFLANNPPCFDAVFAGDDDLAVSVISALKNAGFNVPEDISVVGFDDQRFAELLVPPLTTVHAPTEEVGRVAGQQMLKLLNGQPADCENVLPTKVVIRQSCGCSI